MTALTDYDRLESPGLWRSSPLEQRREVIVGLRDTSLVLSDPKTDMAITHWSLPALMRAETGDVEGPGTAIYRPGLDASETLELHDEVMIAALDRVIKGLKRRRSHPGRLRGFIFGGIVVTVVAGCTLWLPGVLTRQTAAILPAPNLAELGQMALEDLQRVTGSPCTGGLGLRAASALSERLLGRGGGRIMVMRDGLHGALVLPGGLVVISRDLVEAPPDAETAAGYILAALAQRGDEAAQTERFLTHAGLFATLRLLTSGTLPTGSMDGIGETLLIEAVRDPVLTPDQLLPLFEAAQISPRAYADALNGPATLREGLIAKDPFQGISPRPVLDDADWVSLQAICFD
jgi:hypothetical protein